MTQDITAHQQALHAAKLFISCGKISMIALFIISLLWIVYSLYSHKSAWPLKSKICISACCLVNMFTGLIVFRWLFHGTIYASQFSFIPTLGTDIGYTLIYIFSLIMLVIILFPMGAILGKKPLKPILLLCSIFLIPLLLHFITQATAVTWFRQVNVFNNKYLGDGAKPYLANTAKNLQCVTPYLQIKINNTGHIEYLCAPAIVPALPKVYVATKVDKIFYAMLTKEDVIKLQKLSPQLWSIKKWEDNKKDQLKVKAFMTKK